MCLVLIFDFPIVFWGLRGCLHHSISVSSFSGFFKQMETVWKTVTIIWYGMCLTAGRISQLDPNLQSFLADIVSTWVLEVMIFQKIFPAPDFAIIGKMKINYFKKDILIADSDQVNHKMHNSRSASPLSTAILPGQSTLILSYQHPFCFQVSNLCFQILCS